MGRTLPTTNQTILTEITNYSNFKRALRKPDQQLLEELFTYARQHTMAISLADHALPIESMLLAILIEQQRRINDLTERLDEHRY